MYDLKLALLSLDALKHYLNTKKPISSHEVELILDALEKSEKHLYLSFAIHTKDINPHLEP